MSRYPAYSVRLYIGEPPASSATVLFTAPAGTTCVVRDITVCSGSLSTPCAGNFRCSPGNVPVAAYSLSGAYEQWTWTGRLIVPAGETFSVQNTAAGVPGLTVNGYQLSA